MNVLSPAANLQAFLEVFRILSRNFELAWEMTKRELTDRHAGQFIGVVWAVSHPLVQMGVFVFIFAYVFVARMVGVEDVPYDYTTYILCGLIPWLTFNDVLSKGVSSITGNANLVKQLVFPQEILPVKTVWASCLAYLLGMAALILYVLIRYGSLPWTFALVPVLFAFQLLLMMGTCFLISSLGAYFRDLKEFIQIFCMVSVYFLPITYQPTMVPDVFRPVIYANPFSYMIWCYQDACYFGRFESPWAWPIYIGFSISTFVLGYRTFRKLKPYFGNVL